MNPDASALSKLNKVIALSSSDQSGEALAAFKTAKHLLLRQGLSFEDIVSQFFDDKGMPPQRQITELKRQNKSLQRMLNEQSIELKKNKMAMKDLINQVWELGRENTSNVLNDEQPTKTIMKTYRPNLMG
ncbi:MAG: hypothetical protein HQ513_18610 [Rhodospirillales bacterium]|nr:hypothetical protein [Rhodospirillales bacterium]